CSLFRLHIHIDVEIAGKKLHPSSNYRFLLDRRGNWRKGAAFFQQFLHRCECAAEIPNILYEAGGYSAYGGSGFWAEFREIQFWIYVESGVSFLTYSLKDETNSRYKVASCS